MAIESINFAEDEEKCISLVVFILKKRRYANIRFNDTLLTSVFKST